jgi:dTDP-4-dehydrorhamnose 3,5-epimerase
MKFIPLPLEGVFLIEMEPRNDDRGFFARTFCKKEFAQHNLITNFIQMSTSFNHLEGQIRGMHYQAAPFAETKIVRCTRGAIYDVIIDIRENSTTLNQFYGVELSESNGRMLYVPKGFAHGYKTLQANSEVFYMMDEVYHPEVAKEIPWDDRFYS